MTNIIFRRQPLSNGKPVEAKHVVGGYIVLAASDLAHAVELAKGCPVLDADGAVEIRAVETMDM